MAGQKATKAAETLKKRRKSPGPLLNGKEKIRKRHDETSPQSLHLPRSPGSGGEENSFPPFLIGGNASSQRIPEENMKL